jgi:hypothetical protein
LAYVITFLLYKIIFTEYQQMADPARIHLKRPVLNANSVKSIKKKRNKEQVGKSLEISIIENGSLLYRTSAPIHK